MVTVAAVMVVAGFGSPGAGAEPPLLDSRVAEVLEPSDVDGDCHDDVPTDPQLAGGAPLRLSVLLLVNTDVPMARGRDVGAAIVRLYRPVGVQAQVSLRRVAIPGRDVRELITAMRRTVGGVPPRDTDVVHMLTAVDLTSQGDDSSIGLADCIGGIRHPARAFSVSEISDKVRGITLGPVTGSGDEEARSAAHEIGHLLGARHEHSNCVQGAHGSRATDSPCTIMFLAAPSSDVFGELEAAVIRGDTGRYAG